MMSRDQDLLADVPGIYAQQETHDASIVSDQHQKVNRTPS